MFGFGFSFPDKEETDTGIPIKGLGKGPSSFP